MTTKMLYESKLKTVKLYGPMRKRFGRQFELAVANPIEAIRALSNQVPGFKEYLYTSKAAGLVFAIFIGKQNVGEKELDTPAGKEEIRIAPIIEGSKRGGLLQTVVGVALIVLSFVPVLAPVSPFLRSAGISMALGGVVQMLAPQPRGLGAKDDPNNQPSYSMDGAVNTQAQGNPVGLCYGGPLFIGSATISGGIFAEDKT